MTALVAAALVPVVVYCTYILVRRRPVNRDDDAVPLDVVAWHGLMGAVMVISLLRTVSANGAWLGAGLFVVAVVWCVLRTTSRHTAGHHARLFLMSGAMAAMLVPAGPANAATAQNTGHAMTMAAPGGSAMLLSGSGALVVALTMAAVAVAAIRVAGRPAPIRMRLSACCEVVMAGAMVVMAVTLV